MIFSQSSEWTVSGAEVNADCCMYPARSTFSLLLCVGQHILSIWKYSHRFQNTTGFIHSRGVARILCTSRKFRSVLFSLGRFVCILVAKRSSGEDLLLVFSLHPTKKHLEYLLALHINVICFHVLLHVRCCCSCAHGFC